MPYVAGLDTVVNVVSLTLYELYRRPELLARVQTESRVVLEAGFPPEAMRDLKTLHAAVLETMRYHTIANSRTGTRRRISSSISTRSKPAKS
ncbi:MAG: cytochrome P450 [Pleurocapsa sp. SU_196_0]|nr:cytochrome P450 [Pleurocapsa sp. SU_196_0]